MLAMIKGVEGWLGDSAINLKTSVAGTYTALPAKITASLNFR